MTMMIYRDSADGGVLLLESPLDPPKKGSPSTELTLFFMLAQCSFAGASSCRYWSLASSTVLLKYDDAGACAASFSGTAAAAPLFSIRSRKLRSVDRKLACVKKLSLLVLLWWPGGRGVVPTYMGSVMSRRLS